MANQHKHRLRGLRQIPDDDWEKFGANTERAGSDRSGEVLAFIRWFNHEPGAKHPKRPPPDHDARSSGDNTPSDG